MLAFRDSEPAEGEVMATQYRIFSKATLYHPSDPEKPIKLNEAFFDAMIETFDRAGLALQADFNHRSSGGLFEHPSADDGAAAGWITELENRGDDGLWAKIEWRIGETKPIGKGR